MCAALQQYTFTSHTRFGIFHQRIILPPSKHKASTTTNALSALPSGGDDSRFLLTTRFIKARRCVGGMHRVQNVFEFGVEETKYMYVQNIVK